MWLGFRSGPLSAYHQPREGCRFQSAHGGNLTHIDRAGLARPSRGREIRRRLQAASPLVVADGIVILMAWVAAVLLRYDASVPSAAWRSLLGLLPLVVITALTMHTLARLYSGVLRFASILEARQILSAQFATLLVLFPVVWLMNGAVPRSVPIIATMLCCGAAGAIRFWSRLLRWRKLTGEDAERLVVVGAGEAGSALIRAVEQQPGSRVVGVLDDDPRLRGLRIHGCRVSGDLDELASVVQTTGATRAVLAISTAEPELVRRMANTCGDLGVGLSVVPTPAELLGRQVSLQDVRDLEITDLLGRPQVETDLDELVSLLTGRRVMITGGGGSIGSELARQVAAFDPAQLTLVDHDETHLFDASATLPRSTLLRLADIRDAADLSRVFMVDRPEVVFHAAAHKHVPILEAHPVQAARTNVIGTQNVIRAAAQCGAQRFVFISTDKAVRPSSVMGATKLVGEHIALDHEHQMTSCAVRFGNVLGSRGSVVPTFVRQIRAGGPVTVTDGRMTRYFMSIPEAVRLVLHAAALSEGREIFMLDMGEPVRIIDLAKRMVQLSGQRPGADVEIRVTSIRPGEKLAEQLQSPEECQHATTHPSIVRLDPVLVPGEALRAALSSIEVAAFAQEDNKVKDLLRNVLSARERMDLTDILPSQRGEEETMVNVDKGIAWI